MTTSGTTQVSLSYLNQLKTSLEEILAQVNIQLQGVGASTDASTTFWINPVDYNLTVSAGGVGTGTSVTFDAAAALNQALSAMGGSVHDQLLWLSKVLTIMISEVTVTIENFGSTEAANNEAVDELIAEFKSTIQTVPKPAG